MPNKLSKSRPIDKPYAIFINNQGWEWRILKTYKVPTSESKDKYARWFVAATSPHMGEGDWEYGDTYKIDIEMNGRLTWASPEWEEAYPADIKIVKLPVMRGLR